MAKKRVVITGLGIVSSIGLGKNKFLENLTRGKSGAKKISLFVPFDKRHNLACEIRNVDFGNYLGDKGLKYLDRSAKFLLIAAGMALKDARIDYKNIKKRDIGVVVGTDWAHWESNMRFHTTILTKGPSQVSPIDFAGTLANSVTSQVSLKYGLAGLNTTIARGFTSGIDAVGYASNIIRNYDRKMIFTGAVENLSKELYTIFYRMGWLFDSIKRKGVIIGEGSCGFILEEAKAASVRGARVLAEVRSYGFSFGANKEAMKKSILLALESAKIKPREVSCIIPNKNGGTRDKDEAGLIAELFSSYEPVLIAVKDSVGECLGASASMQIAAGCLSSKTKAGFILVNSFGLDGNNACLILKKGGHR